MTETLLLIHIASGSIALFSAALAISTEKGKKIHVLSGKSYFWGMVLIFLTAIPMSIINSNVFLFLIAIFSFYLAFSGMRFAKNRTGVPTRVDLIAVITAVLVVNVDIEPVWIWWVLPTALIVPFIVWWNRKVLK